MEPSQVHVWHARVDDRSTDALSEDERATAARFRFPRDRRRFCFGRAMLRTLVGSYIGVAPADVALAYSPSGKPHLPDSELQFNLSHSQDVVVCAISRNRRVGIDVEWVRPMRDAESIVERFFSPAEIASFKALPAESRPRGFFNGWTRKEAFVKALGAGLGYALAEFTVSLAPGEPACLLAVPPDQAAAGWTLSEVVLDPAYVCALVAEGGASEVCCRSWPN